MTFSLLFEILEYQQARYPHKVAAAGWRNGQWHTLTTAELLAERDQISAGLLYSGLHPGDRVGILAHCGSPEWLIADAAMMQTGIIPVPIHATARPDEMAHIAQDAELKACFVSNADMLQKLRGSGMQLKQVFSFDPHSD
ncbi:MAG TPA: hypothetical protein DCF33_13825, partial [Saprospirales bacterium]|nr:hypothetical protein [Saprospirales bacterium]